MSKRKRQTKDESKYLEPCSHCLQVEPPPHRDYFRFTLHDKQEICLACAQSLCWEFMKRVPAKIREFKIDTSHKEYYRCLGADGDSCLTEQSVRYPCDWDDEMLTIYHHSSRPCNFYENCYDDDDIDPRLLVVMDLDRVGFHRFDNEVSFFWLCDSCDRKLFNDENPWFRCESCSCAMVDSHLTLNSVTYVCEICLNKAWVLLKAPKREQDKKIQHLLDQQQEEERQYVWQQSKTKLLTTMKKDLDQLQPPSTQKWQQFQDEITSLFQRTFVS